MTHEGIYARRIIVIMGIARSSIAAVSFMVVGSTRHHHPRRSFVGSFLLPTQAAATGWSRTERKDVATSRPEHRRWGLLPFMRAEGPGWRQTERLEPGFQFRVYCKKRWKML